MQKFFALIVALALTACVQPLPDASQFAPWPDAEADAATDAESTETAAADADSTDAESPDADATDASSSDADSLDADSLDADSGDADSADVETGTDSTEFDADDGSDVAAEVTVDADVQDAAVDVTETDAEDSEIAEETAEDAAETADAAAEVDAQTDVAVDPCAGVVCADGNACTTDSCDPVTKNCVFVNNTSTCNDGDGCTASDTCANGTCSGTNICQCQMNSDCAKKEDGNLCNGTLYCAKPSADVTTWACVVNPASIVTCPSVDDTVCAQNKCDVKTGTCTMKAVSTFTTCDDGDPCTTGEVCDKTTGVCVASANICGCASSADCPDDGDLCNGVPYCDLVSGTCKINPASVKTCSTSLDSPCTRTMCVASSGKCVTLPVELTVKKDPGCVESSGQKCAWVPLPKGATPLDVLCDDSNSCTDPGGTLCQGGTCEASDAAYTCVCGQDSDCADDGNLCNGKPFCDKTVGRCKINPATVVTCASTGDSTCARNVCEPASGACKLLPIQLVQKSDPLCDPSVKQCAYVPRDPLSLPKDASTTIFIACDDGDSCTKDDGCSAGKCASGTNICPCNSNSDCQDDGNLCNGTPFCDHTLSPAGCVLNPATVVSCPAATDTFCRQNLCDPASGKCAITNVNEGSLCSDGNPCTVSEVCSSGACKAETNTCVCTSNADCASKEDGNLCNGTLFCDKSTPPYVCRINPATIVSCPSVDDTACSKNVCAAKTGMCGVSKMPDLFTTCDDSNPCTKGDVCMGGACSSGTNVCSCAKDGDCTSKEDGNVCNGTLFCDLSTLPHNCAVNPATAISCPDNGVCAFGICDPISGNCGLKSAGLDCNDANSCTLDVCDPGLGCTHANLGSSGVCTDGNACTSNDGCSGSDCVGTTLNCDDGNVCTLDSCSVATGCGHSPASGSCDDGDACSVNDACAGSTCTGTAKDCEDGDACTADSCSKGKCSSGAPCFDGNPCTQDICGSGTCSHPLETTGLPCDDGKVCTTGETCTAGGSCSLGSAVTCGAHATCSEPGGCACDLGYLGDGTTCEACKPQTIFVNSDGKTVCAPDYPAWGLRSVSPQAGWFTVFADSIMDSQSGLQWQITDGGYQTWSDANAACLSLDLAGKSDWRLPTRAEMNTIIDYSVAKPAMVSVFPKPTTNFHWTLTPSGSSGTHTAVGTDTGVTLPGYSDDFAVNAICVRATGAGSTGPSAGRFVVSGSSNTVLDNLTGLTWQRSAASGKLLSDATNYCNTLSLDGSGWRLPTVVEIASLVDLSQSSATIDPIAFPSTNNDYYWSSTVSKATAGEAWFVSFGLGPISTAEGSTTQLQTRCVR